MTRCIPRRKGIVGGLFVDGQSSRTGRARGLLQSAEGGALIARAGALFDALHVPWVLIGGGAAYADLTCDILEVDPPGAGPLVGLIALLRHAASGTAVALGCDMPFISRSLLARLVLARRGPAIVAPRPRGEQWEPLFARFEADQVLPEALARSAAGQHSLQELFDELRATPLPTTPEEERQLEDWDAPKDIDD